MYKKLLRTLNIIHSPTFFFTLKFVCPLSEYLNRAGYPAGSFFASPTEFLSVRYEFHCALMYVMNKGLKKIPVFTCGNPATRTHIGAT